MSGEPSRAAVRALIRELAHTERPATPEDIARIRGLMATAPFDPRAVPVAPDDRGHEYLGRRLGDRAPSLSYHLIKRTIVDGQWAEGLSAHDFLGDQRRAVSAPTARLCVYERRGGLVAVTVTPTADSVPTERIGPSPQPHLLVIYSADHDIILTGYQFSAFDQVSIPQEARWLT